MTFKTVPEWTVPCCTYAVATVSLHRLTGKQAEKLDPSKVPLRANTLGHTLKKMPCMLVNWSAETAAHSSFCPIYSSTAINKEQV